MARNGDERDPWDRWFRRVTGLVALGLVVYEAVFAHEDRPYLLLLLGSLVTGVPIALLLEGYLRRKGD